MFSFVLLVNDDEKYDIVDCDPEIDAVELKEILEELNRSGGEDISILARRMRKYSMRWQCIKRDIFVTSATLTYNASCTYFYHS